MGNLIEVEGLTKVYPDGTRAVDDVSFHVAEGELFGFLGPNGAGKTRLSACWSPSSPRPRDAPG